MTAALTLLKIVPAWCYGIIALCAVLVGAEYHGRAHVQNLWNVERAELSRIAQKAHQRNDEIIAKQAADNMRISKGYKSELAKIMSKRTGAPRLRLPNSLCAGGVSAAAQGTQGSDASPAAAVLLPEQIDRSLRALAAEADTVLAGCRALQNFVTSNGLAP